MIFLDGYLYFISITLTRKCKVTWIRNSLESSRYNILLLLLASLGGVGDAQKKRSAWNVCVLAHARVHPRLLRFNVSLRDWGSILISLFIRRRRWRRRPYHPRTDYKDSNPIKIERFIGGSNLLQDIYNSDFKMITSLIYLFIYYTFILKYMGLTLVNWRFLRQYQFLFLPFYHSSLLFYHSPLPPNIFQTRII